MTNDQWRRAVLTSALTDLQFHKMDYGAWCRHYDHIHQIADGWPSTCGFCCSIWWKAVNRKEGEQHGRPTTDL
jgi:hypothetical protein